MFRLNGDITRQLNLNFDAYFKEKYKNELKERIIAFVQADINNLYHNETFYNKYLLLSSFIEFEKGTIKSFNKEYFLRIKNELFNSFNPLWYTKKETKKRYLKKDLQQYLSVFINKNQADMFKQMEAYPNFSTTIFHPFNVLRQFHFYLKQEKNDVVFNVELKQSLIDYIDKEYLNLIYSFLEKKFIRFSTYEKDYAFEKINSYFDDYFKNGTPKKTFGQVLSEMLSFNFGFREVEVVGLHTFVINNKYRCRIEQLFMSIYYFQKIKEQLKE